MKYLIVGDVHGNWDCFSQHVNHVKQRGIPFDEIIQVGDFGFYGRSMNLFNHYKRKINYPIHFICGNHEDHDLLEHYPKIKEQFGLTYHKKGDITIVDHGVKIGWMGGAFNVDRPQEFINGTQNFPSKEEISTMIGKVNALDGVDLMITHSCPQSIGVAMKGSNFFNATIDEFIVKLGYPASPVWDCGDQPLTDLWHGLNKKPKDWVFGHFHKRHQGRVGTTNFFCVGACDYHFDTNVPMFLYDTEYKQVFY